jgi:hypothetical protein
MLPSEPAIGVVSISGSWSGSPSTWELSQRKAPSSRRRHTTLPRLEVAMKSPLGRVLKEVYERGAPCGDRQSGRRVPMSTPTTVSCTVPMARTRPDTAGLAVTFAPIGTSPSGSPVVSSRKRQRPSTGLTATSPVARSDTGDALIACPVS